jgi:radical SAM protein with 4Fe4S-binding SPASM domain
MIELDRITEGERERELMQRVRSGALSPADVERVNLPFFVKIQIQTTTACNAACVTCPYPETAKTLPMGRMSEETFRAVVEQMRGRGVERTSLFLQNEPLVDPRLEEFTRILKEREPKTRATLVTNGHFLDGARAVALAEAGTDEISVSVNGFDEKSYEATMEGLSFERILANLAEVGAAKRAGSLGTMDVRVVALEMPGIAGAVAAFHERVGLDVYLKPVTNRAGSIDVSAMRGPQTKVSARAVACQRPFVKAYVLYDGDVVLCNCDWRRTWIVGNVHRSDLATIWKGERLNVIRRAMVTLQFPADSPCAQCDYPYLIDA